MKKTAETNNKRQTITRYGTYHLTVAKLPIRQKWKDGVIDG